MPKRDWRLLVDDIVASITNIEKYIMGVEQENFINNQMLIDAVVRNLEIIGESAKWLPEDIKTKFFNIEWHKLIGLRNRIVHDYFSVDLEIIWFIIQNELTPLKKKINDLLKNNS